MSVLLLYLLKVATIQIIIFAFYWLLLRCDTFYKMVRYYFLTGLIFSYIIPLIRFNITVEQPVNTFDLNQFLLNANIAGEAVTTAWWVRYSFNDYLIAIIAVGIISMSIRFFIQYLALNGLHVKQRENRDTYSILSVDIPIKPFSFGKRIYLNPDLHNQQELDEIINHELVHIRQNHHIDILLGVVNKCLFWWNPAVWGINTAIRNNLEYIVDNEMLQLGFDRKHYQYHLLYISQLPYSNRIANHFNLSNLKKRIMMMNKEKSRKVYKTKLLLLIPVITLFFLSFNLQKTLAYNLNLNDGVEYTDTTAGSIGYGLKYDTLKQNGNGSSIRIRGVSKNKNGESATLPLIVIDGKESTDRVLSSINPERIESMSILKEESATSIYGDKGKNGVILISLKTSDSDYSEVRNAVYTKSESEKIVVRGGVGTTSEPLLVIVDGKESDMNSVDSDGIESISIIKDDATKIYGDKGKNGVIIITLKK